MANLVEGRFKSFDETEIFFQIWPCEGGDGKTKALVIGTHGLGEYSGGYSRLGKALAQKQIQLCMFDHRGHGRSEGKRGVGTIDEFVLDLKIFIQKMQAHFPGIPYFYLGHSMGGLVLLKYLIRSGMGTSRGVILSSPFLGINVPIPAWKKSGAKYMAKLLPEVTLFNEIENQNLTHDLEVLKEYERDSWRHDRISSALYMSMLESLDFVFANRDKLKEPVYFQIAGDDRVVSRPDAEKFFNLLPFQNKNLKIYNGFYHEIYNEVNRAEPFKDLTDWIENEK